MSAPSSTRPLIPRMRLRALGLLSRLYATNPFEPAWEELVRDALRDEYRAGDGTSRGREGPFGKNREEVEKLLGVGVSAAAASLGDGVAATAEERALYQGAGILCLWMQFADQLQGIIDDDAVAVPFYDEFVYWYRHAFSHRGLSVPEPPHLLALFYQWQRAWYFAASKIPGRSPSAQAARVAIFQANLGGDVCLHAEGLYLRMDEIPVLITGETGTGKELAAECIGWSRYIPFDLGRRCFVTRYAEDFHPRNLGEIPADLVDSALFGHKRGAFTGATADASGWLGLAKLFGTVFFDEIGEIGMPVQVKLLRPLQSRRIVPVGGTQEQPIAGRIMFATHRDLAALCREGKFRDDLYQRMNAMRVHMPTLRQMIGEAPEELRHYVRGFVAEKIHLPEQVQAWTERVVGAIRATRPLYPWPGNLRELKNYTDRYIMTGGRSSEPDADLPERPPPTVRMREPAIPGAPPAAPESRTESSSGGLLGRKVKEGMVTLEELTTEYVSWMHTHFGNENKTETARLTGVDRRTVGKYLDKKGSK